MRCLLVGNYGVGNLGDEALKEYFLRGFEGIEWTVLSACPEKGEMPRLPGGIRSLILLPWWRTIGAYRHADAVVFGGGTLFTDIESVYACILWFLHAGAAVFFGKPLLLAFQGIGPFRTRFGEKLARWVVSHAMFVSVRDEASLRRIQRWKMNKEVVQTYDPIFTQITGRNRDRTQRVLIIIPRNNSPKSFEERAKKLQTNERWDEVKVLSLDPDHPKEHRMCQSLLAALRLPPSALQSIHTLNELEAQVVRGAFVLTQRFHGAIVAFAAHVPFEAVAQSTGDKLEEVTRLARDESGRERVHTWIFDGERALKETLGRC